MPIPCYPDFTPVDLAVKDSLHPRLSLTVDGVSEFTFAGLYLFRNRYQYRVSHDGPDGGFIISGVQPENGETFFMTPCGVPRGKVLADLFKAHDYWKNVSDSVLAAAQAAAGFPAGAENSAADENQASLLRNIDFTPDRDNFDYLYLRGELAELSGKKFHKKKNLVNHFLHAYPAHEKCQLTPERVPHAMEVLDRWREDKGEEGDYRAAREALELFGALRLRGGIYYVEGKPAAYCLGESIAKGKMFAIHFEKALDEYKGVYQFMNQAFASALPRFFTHLNREQDMGDEGLRQAKMTYRPSGFVQKHTGRLKDTIYP